MDKKSALQKICDELSAQSIMDEYTKQESSLDYQKKRIGVLGQPNSGKTTLINTFLQLDLPVSNLPSAINYTIVYSDDSQITEEGLSNDKKVIAPLKWLKENNVEIREVNKEILPDETTPVEVCQLLSQCDECIYMLNMQAALNKTDMFVLENLNDVGVPTAVILSRADLLPQQDKDEVLSYVKGNLHKFQNVVLVELSESIPDSASTIKTTVETLLSKANIQETRNNFKDFYLGMALGQLYEECQGKINACAEKTRAIEENAKEKKRQINEKTLKWIEIETMLTQRFSDITTKLRSTLDSRKADMLRRLSHDVDVCGDVKLFWEKDFPFRLEELMKVESAFGAQMVNQELVKTIQWLQDELMRQFKCKISFASGIAGDRPQSYTDNNPNVAVADTNKLKIVTRIGTAATVIAAGTLLATSGIGGIIMAVSMVSGLGAEFFMRKKSNESKEQIKRYLPEIVDRAQIQLVDDFNQKFMDVSKELTAQLRVLKADWIDSSTKNVDQEKAIALYNFSPEKWNAIMERINQLSEIILK